MQLRQICEHNNNFFLIFFVVVVVVVFLVFLQTAHLKNHFKNTQLSSYS